jgi:hypothetical protein
MSMKSMTIQSRLGWREAHLAERSVVVGAGGGFLNVAPEQAELTIHRHPVLWCGHDGGACWQLHVQAP